MIPYQAETVDYLKSRFRQGQFNEYEVVITALSLAKSEQLDKSHLKNVLLDIFDGDATVLLEALEQVETKMSSKLLKEVATHL